MHYMKTFQKLLKRLHLFKTREKGTLFSFSTSVEKDSPGFYSKNKL